MDIAEQPYLGFLTDADQGLETSTIGRSRPQVYCRLPACRIQTDHRGRRKPRCRYVWFFFSRQRQIPSESLRSEPSGLQPPVLATIWRMTFFRPVTPICVIKVEKGHYLLLKDASSSGLEHFYQAEDPNLWSLHQLLLRPPNWWI